MSLIARIQADALAARVARQQDRALFLVTLLAEASRPGKDAGNRESTDDEVLGVMRSFVKNTKTTIGALEDAGAQAVFNPAHNRYNQALNELAVLNEYLPAQATEEDVQRAIDEAVAALPEKNIKQMGAVMAALNAKFGAAFDKAMASGLVKKALA